MSDILHLYDGFCCQVWPLLVGVAPRPCGKCGQVPVGIPNTTRTVQYDPSNEPRIVATLKEES